MGAKKEIRLSSKWTKFNIYIQLIACLVGGCVFFILVGPGGFKDEMLIFLVIDVILIILIIYQFVNVCEAHVIDNKLVLKKQFRPSKSYTFEKIGNTIHSFQTKRIRYTVVKMENDDKEQEKYLIMNNRDLSASEKKDVKEILISLRDTVKED